MREVNVQLAVITYVVAWSLIEDYNYILAITNHLKYNNKTF